MISENFHNRRQMRLKRNAVIHKSPFVLLDIGSSKIAAMLVQFMPGDEGGLGPSALRVLASCGIASNGVEFGEISAMSHLENDVLRALEAVQKQAGLRADHAAICFSGGRPGSYMASGESKVIGGEVGNSDISAALSACEFPELAPGREFLHALPINFTLDHRTGLYDPRRQIGASLAVDVHLLAVDRGILQALRQLMRRADMELVDLSNSAYMSGLACLSEDEQEHGAAVIDFGAMTTSIALYFRKQLVFVSTIRLGGFHITNDLAIGLRISHQAAERMKTLHGGAVATSADDREAIEIEGAEYDERRYLTRSELIGIIRPRLEEILEEVQGELEQAGIQHLPSRRVVLTGGASQLPGIEELAEHYLGRQIRMGRTIRLPGASTPQTNPSFAALTGLALSAASPRDELWDFVELFEPEPSGGLRGFVSWFRQNW